MMKSGTTVTKHQTQLSEYARDKAIYQIYIAEGYFLPHKLLGCPRMLR